MSVNRAYLGGLLMCLLLSTAACANNEQSDVAQEATSPATDTAESESTGAPRATDAATTTSSEATATTPTSPPVSFSGRALVTLSDADMVPSAYVDGQLGELQQGISDTLTILPLPLDLENRSPQPATVAQTTVANSVTAWPLAMTVSSDGATAYVVNTRSRPSGAEIFDDLVFDTTLQSVDLNDITNPQVVDTTEVASGPRAVAVNPQGDLLAIGTGDPERLIQLVPVEGTQLGEPQDFSPIGVAGELEEVPGLSWHPSGEFLAITIPEPSVVAFYRVAQDDQGQYELTLWGEPLMVDDYPATGHFTPDGQYFVFSLLYWGPEVDGFFVGAPQGRLTSIRFDATSDSPSDVEHEEVSSVEIGISPEGLAMSPDGSLFATPNMIRSYVPWDDPRLTPYSSISLISLDAETGELRASDEYQIDGMVLPQGIAFDADGQNLAVTSSISFDLTERRGTVSFFRIVPGETPSLETTGFSASVVRGPHQLFLIP